MLGALWQGLAAGAGAAAPVAYGMSDDIYRGRLAQQESDRRHKVDMGQLWDNQRRTDLAVNQANAPVDRSMSDYERGLLDVRRFEAETARTNATNTANERARIAAADALERTPTRVRESEARKLMDDLGKEVEGRELVKMPDGQLDALINRRSGGRFRSYADAVAAMQGGGYAHGPQAGGYLPQPGFTPRSLNTSPSALTGPGGMGSPGAGAGPLTPDLVARYREQWGGVR